MATHAHTSGAPTRAPAFPSLVPLEDAAEQLEAVGGALGVLAAYLEKLDVGTDTPLAVYAAGHAVDRIRKIIADTTQALMDHEHAVEGR